MTLRKGSLIVSFVFGIMVLSFSMLANAGTLTFTPAGDIFEYGDVYIGQMANKGVFTISAAGGNCSGAVALDFSQPLPSGTQTLASFEFNLVDGDTSDPVWIGIQSTEPGDHNLYLVITSTCGTYYKTVSFHCIGYGFIQGRVIDATTGDPLPLATVGPGNPSQMRVTMFGEGRYIAEGYPGYHWLIANAPGYAEKMVDFQVQEANTINYNFQMTSTLHADPDNLKMNLRGTASVQITGSKPPYTVTSSSLKIASATIAETLMSVTANSVGDAVLTITDNAGNQTKVAVQVVNSSGALPARNLLLTGEE